MKQQPVSPRQNSVHHRLPYVHAALVAISVFLGSGRARADLLTFTDELNFLTAAGSPTLESFEGLDDRTLSSDPIVTDPFTLVIESGTADIRSSPFTGKFATDGEKYVRATSQAVIRFDMNVPVTSFGLSFTDWGDGGEGTLTIFTDAGEASGGIQIAENPPELPNANLLFFGLVQDMAFSSITIASTSTADGWGIDEVYFTSVPEPNSMILAAIGLAALGFVASRSRRTSRPADTNAAAPHGGQCIRGWDRIVRRSSQGHCSRHTPCAVTAARRRVASGFGVLRQ